MARKSIPHRANPPRLQTFIEALAAQPTAKPRKSQPPRPIPEALRANLWKPGQSGNPSGLPKPEKRFQGQNMKQVIRTLTLEGRIIVEFCMRVLLGQDLRLYREFAPLLLVPSGFRGRMGSSAALKRVQAALAELPEPPVITMEDRKWAVQFLAAYGWGLPGKAADHKPEGEGGGELAQRAGELIQVFEPQGPEEQARLRRVMELIEGPDGTYTPREGGGP